MAGRATLLVLITALVLATGRAVPAWAQPAASIDVSVDRAQVTVGDRIAVTVTLRLPASAQPDLSPVEQQFGSLDVLAVDLPQEQALADGRKEIRARYEVAAFSPGATQVPPLSVAYKSTDGATATVTSQAVPITVMSVIPPGASPTAVRDLKPQIDLAYRAGIPARTVAAVAAFVAAVLTSAALAGWWLWRRQHRAVSAPPVPVPVASPESAARAELDRIAGLGLLDAGDARTFHALLADCIRGYLSARYEFPAFAMTTGELRGRMEQYGVDRWQARLAAGLLAECDAVAYAGYRPARPRAETNLSMAYEIVAVTEPAQAEAEVGVGG